MKYVLLFLFVALVVYIVFLDLNKNVNRPTTRIVKRLPHPRSAMTIPPFGILIKEGNDTKEIRRHEACHWKQYQKLGLLPFYFNYFREHIKNGYDQNAYEIECYSN
jgi:hypothetical protein